MHGFHHVRQYKQRRDLDVDGERGFTGELWIEDEQTASSGRSQVTNDEGCAGASSLELVVHVNRLGFLRRMRSPRWAQYVDRRHV